MKERLICYPRSTFLKDIFRTNYVSRQPIYAFFHAHALYMEGKILDLGCGNMPYKELFKKADEYIGLDVETAKSYGFNVNDVKYYDGKNIPYDDESIDNIISIQTFEHIQDIDYSLHEMNRVLKKGGTMCFSCPMVGYTHYRPYDFRRFTSYGLMEALKKNGFKRIEICGSNRPIDTMHFIKIATVARPFRKIYAIYANLFYLYGRSKLKCFFDACENWLRKVLKRNAKINDLDQLPLNWLVSCKK